MRECPCILREIMDWYSDEPCLIDAYHFANQEEATAPEETQGKRRRNYAKTITNGQGRVQARRPQIGRKQRKF
jgi:hypothetical protein